MSLQKTYLGNVCRKSKLLTLANYFLSGSPGFYHYQAVKKDEEYI